MSSDGLTDISELRMFPLVHFRGLELCHRVLKSKANLYLCVDVIFACVCVCVCMGVHVCLFFGFDSQFNRRWSHTVCTGPHLRRDCLQASSPRPPVLKAARGWSPWRSTSV